MAYQVERHCGHGVWDVVEVDLTAVLGASIDDLVAPWQLVARDLVGEGQAGIGQEPEKAAAAATAKKVARALLKAVSRASRSPRRVPVSGVLTGRA